VAVKDSIKLVGHGVARIRYKDTDAKIVALPPSIQPRKDMKRFTKEDYKSDYKAITSLVASVIMMAIMIYSIFSPVAKQYPFLSVMFIIMAIISGAGLFGAISCLLENHRKQKQ
jgi:hypothetical protein